MSDRRAWVLVCAVLSSGCSACEPPRAHDAGPPAALISARSIADHRPGPRSVAVDDANVYWVESYTGDVMRAPRGGGAPARLATTGSTSTTALAVGGGFAYWSDPAQGAVFRVATSGTGPPERVIGYAARALAADATHVYALAWQLARVRHDGATEPRWDPGVRGTTLALGPMHACATGEGDLLRCASLEDGRVVALARDVSRDHALAVSRTHVFLCDERVLLRIPLEGGAPEALGAPCGIGSALAADGSDVIVVGIQGDVQRIDPARRTGVMLFASLGHMNRNHIDVVIDDGELFAAVDSASFGSPLVDLTNPNSVPDVRFDGVIESVLLRDARAMDLPLATTLHVAWIDDESDAALERAVSSIETAGGPASGALREGILALRLVAHDRGLADRAAERLRARLAYFGPSLRVVIDPSVEARTVAGQVEIVFALDELARAYAPHAAQ